MCAAAAAVAPRTHSLESHGAVHDRWRCVARNGSPAVKVVPYRRPICAGCERAGVSACAHSARGHRRWVARTRALQADCYAALFTAVGENADLIAETSLFWIDNPSTSDYVDGGHMHDCFYTPCGKPAWGVLLAAYAQPGAV